MRLSLLLACACALPGAFAADWPPETVQPQKTISVQMPGATAAFSLGPGIVEADAANGVVQLHGIAPGTTSVIVVEPAGSLSITVIVPEPRRANGRGGPLQPGEREAVETGSYEARYASEPQQFTNALDLRRQEGDPFRGLQIVNSNYFGSSIG